MKRAIREKLLNLVTFNPIDYCVKSSITQRHIDIAKYVQNSAFLNFINGETNSLEISAASGINVFETELKNSKNAQEFMTIVNNNGFSMTDNRLQELVNNFELNKKKSISYYTDQMKAFKRQFISLNRAANTYYNDTTVWPLYVAYRFLTGKIGNSVIIKAPLIIFKVAVMEEGNKLFLRKLEEQPIVNEKIQVVMNKEFPSIASTDDLLNNMQFAEYIQRYEQMVGYKIKIDDIDLLINFKNETPKMIEDRYQSLVVENSSLLGIFEPGGGALKEDLKQIIDRDEDPFESQIEGDIKSNAFYEDKIIKDPAYIFEIDKPLNIYQKYAVASAMNQSTLIYGPPGTGKSEVIANIICNVIIKGKSALMVSEKKAALEVLTNRICSLSQFALYLYETNNRESFYKKIDNLNNLLGTQWYRESARTSRATTIDPIKFNKDELIFVKNFEDWYQELSKLIKKHWTIEDYTDGIFKLDFVDVQNLRNELGEDLCIEWLQNINIEGYGSTTLLEAFKKIYNGSNNIFPNIETFFYEYIKFKKFVKKYNLLENRTSEELNKYIKFVLNKVNTSSELVERFLLGGNKLANIFTEYFTFIEKYKSAFLEQFIKKTNKERKAQIALINNYLVFRDRVMLRNSSLSTLTPDQLISKVKAIENFFSKYKRVITSTNWFSFMLNNARNLESFINLYKVTPNQEVKEIMFAEFVLNNNVTNKTDESSLNIKQVKLAAKDIEIIIPMFEEFISNLEHLDNDYSEELVQYKDLFAIDVEFLNSLTKIAIIFDHDYQEIIREWDWISQPFIRYLYQTPILPFDLEKIQPVTQLITAPINNEQFMKLRVVSMWNDVIKQNPMFLEMKGVHLQDVIQSMRKEAIRSASIIEELVFKKYINNLRNFLIRLPKEDKDEIANVLRIASSSVRPPIGQFVKRYYKALKQLFPIWVARPDNVADMIPLNLNEFDYGIFDEASQISIERAYPLVYRTNIKIVSGDDKQLRPTSFFMNKLSQQDFDIDDFDAVESLLERAKVSWWNSFNLKNHYRSDCKELIEFSNKFIYNNSLEVATKAGVNEVGIEVFDVHGTWDQVNREEADKVVELLIQYHHNYETILIITFNSRQSFLIESTLMEKRSKLPVELTEKLDNNNISITNLENVQGNEGDLVILSVSYGKNADGVIKSNFGPLILSGGSNRLNVAITRARKKMLVVKSLTADQIRVNPQNKNAVIFKKFIEYTDNIKHNLSIDNVTHEIADEEPVTEVVVEAKANEIEKQESTNEALNFSSSIIKEIYGDLLKALPPKFKIINDFKVGSKNIDLLIVNKETNQPIKAILVERWKTNRTIKDMLEDVDRQYFLEDRGYATFRVKQYTWCIDRHRIITKIKDGLSDLKNNSRTDYVLWQSDK